MARALTVALVGLLLAGCVERRMQIRSNPPGAEVYIDETFVGLTPVDVPFSHYGSHDVTLRHPKFQTLSQRWTVDVPFYEWFPLDFFAEWVWPGTLHDNHLLELTMEPMFEITTERVTDLRERAVQLRDEGRKIDEEPTPPSKP